MPDEQSLSPAEQEPQTPQTTAEPTLDDVYRDAGLEVTQAPVQATPQAPAPQPPARVEPSNVPDPYDTAAFKAYIAQQQAGTSELQKTVTTLVAHLSMAEAARARESLQADISKAVEQVNEVVNHPKPKVVEAMLDAKAREDSKFKALWENRSKNPQAWSNALKVVAKEFAADLSVKVDPSLVAAQRARKESQRQMATTEPDSPEKSWEGISQEQFDQKWQQLVSGGN